MFECDNSSLQDQLLAYFKLQSIKINEYEFRKKLNSINSVEDLELIDKDINNILWAVVPQIAMRKFGLNAFKGLNPCHKVEKTFVFINPIHASISDDLKIDLNNFLTISEEIDIILTDKVVSTLYGGYSWYSAYFKSCEYLGCLGKKAKIIIFRNINVHKINMLIDYKNNNRDRLSPRVIISKDIINTEMDGIVNSFHSPDLIENYRQLLGLNLMIK